MNVNLKTDRLRNRGLGAGKPLRLKRMWRGIRAGTVINPPAAAARILVEEGTAEEVVEPEVPKVDAGSQTKKKAHKKVKDDTHEDS